MATLSPSLCIAVVDGTFAAFVPVPSKRLRVRHGIALTFAVSTLFFAMACDGGPDVFRPTPSPSPPTPEDDAGTSEPEVTVESPCRPIRCGDGIVDAPETCDPADPETRAQCGENCQEQTPAGWTCFSQFFDDDFCDCGCGIADPRCPDASVSSCDFVHCLAGRVPQEGNPSVCTTVVVPGDTCASPISISGLSGSVTGRLDANDDFDGVLYDTCTFDPSVGEGGDVVYRLPVPNNTILEVKLVTTEFSPTLFVLTECGVDPTTCVAAGENFLQRDVAELELAQFQGGTRDRFIIVDSYAGKGDYTLTWRELENPACGDGVRDPYDNCDDGNTQNGDGCSQNCLVEEGFACPIEGGACVVRGCGNGIKEFDEICDDGNTNGDDGCSAICQFEPATTWTCPVVYFGSDDGCDCGCGAFDPDCASLDRSSCQYENCNTGVEQDETLNYTCRAPACGDGIVEGAEECDDGNDDGGDGCFECLREAPPEWTCPARWYGANDGCHCGCGTVDPDCTSPIAACDVNGCILGGPDAEDNSKCIVHICGDGVVDVGELCDDGNTINGDGCAANCQYIEEGFVCDGNTP